MHAVFDSAHSCTDTTIGRSQGRWPSHWPSCAASRIGPADIAGAQPANGQSVQKIKKAHGTGLFVRSTRLYALFGLWSAGVRKAGRLDAWGPRVAKQAAVRAWAFQGPYPEALTQVGFGQAARRLSIEKGMVLVLALLCATRLGTD
jgi:hypothetical protein